MTPLEWLFNDNGIVQLTHQLQPYKKSQWLHGTFDDADKLRAEALRLDMCGNLFVSLNRPQPCDVSNQVNSSTAFKNDDMARYSRILIDLDVERDGYIPSTEDELSLALEQRAVAQKFFRALDWPRPAYAMSGNGAHLLFRTALTCNDENRQKMAAIMKGLKGDLSTDRVKLDTKVNNACRIHPLYGTMKRKGDQSVLRPYRITGIILPPQWCQVSERQFDTLAEHYARQQRHIVTARRVHGGFMGNGDYTTLDAVAWIQSHGLYIQQAEPGKHWITCPWNSEHSGTGVKDTVLWERGTNGKPVFHCSHDHCADRTLWDVIQLFGDADRYCAKEYVFD